MKYEVNNIDYEIFHEIALSILNAHTPLKKASQNLKTLHKSIIH